MEHKPKHVMLRTDEQTRFSAQLSDQITQLCGMLGMNGRVSPPETILALALSAAEIAAAWAATRNAPLSEVLEEVQFAMRDYAAKAHPMYVERLAEARGEGAAKDKVAEPTTH